MKLTTLENIAVTLCLLLVALLSYTYHSYNENKEQQEQIEQAEIFIDDLILMINEQEQESEEIGEWLENWDTDMQADIGELTQAELALCSYIAHKNNMVDAIYIAREAYLVCSFEYSPDGSLLPEAKEARDWIENNI